MFKCYDALDLEQTCLNSKKKKKLVSTEEKLVWHQQEFYLSHFRQKLHATLEVKVAFRVGSNFHKCLMKFREL